MSNKKYSFETFLEEQGSIRIPKIQRDYAQGRTDKDVTEIRKSFVHTLMMVVKGKKDTTELDFIYGSTKDNAFEPLDGQQRLTTLFLLHWFFGVDLRMDKDSTRSKFTYETRNTSVEFCDELVSHSAKMFVDEADKKGLNPSDIIKARDWFKWEWKYDPTISSMLVMIDSISNELDDDWEEHLSEYRNNLGHITFNRLNLGEFGLSDELFIKMNARGKLLSDFDKLKSTLEEELQLQQKEKDANGEPLATTDDEKQWRTLMDGAWIDLFWHKYARKIIEDTANLPDEERKKSRLAAAKLSESQFKRLLLRIISLELLENPIDDDNLIDAAYGLSYDLLYNYTDSLSDVRSNDTDVVIPEGKGVICFGKLIRDINSLIYRDSDGTYYETSWLLSKETHIENNDSTLFDDFLADRVGNDVELVFYAMLMFLRAFPMKRSSDDILSTDGFSFDQPAHNVWLANLNDWVRAFRNILLNDNNNQRIDKKLFFLEAMNSIQEMSNDFLEFVSSEQVDVETDKYAVKRFLASIGKTYTRIDNQSLREETEKAKLQLNDGRWEESIKTAEAQPYLWGQIRCLLSWGQGNLETFEKYRSHLFALLDYIANDQQMTKYYTLILALFPDCWKESNRLYFYNRDRDNSFKRYLRELSKEHNVYGYYFKALIDIWINEFGDADVIDLAEAVISFLKDNVQPWLRCLFEKPVILQWAWNRRIFEVEGHVILPQRKTLDSHCFDPIFLYLRELCIDKGLQEEKDFEFYDSKSDYGHAFRLGSGNQKLLTEWSDNAGNYSISTDGEKQEVSPEQLLAIMKEKINA